MLHRIILLGLLILMISSSAQGINEKVTRNGKLFPWGVKLRSYYDQALREQHPEGDWFLNLGTTGIRARLSRDQPKRFVVEYVFKDKLSPAHGKVYPGDVIVGVNGKAFEEPHQFGKVGDGWNGPLMAMALAIEESQAKDGILTLNLISKKQPEKPSAVRVDLGKKKKFSSSFPFECKRSEEMLGELCEFLIKDYRSENWKKQDQFYGGAHAQYQQLLAILASGIKKYDPIIKKEMKSFYGKKYSPTDGGFRMWGWGYEAIVMGEYYGLTQDKELIAPMKSLAEAMPWGSFNANGIYTHRSHITIRVSGKKPYASIASLSGLKMLGMSLFKQSGLYYDKDLYETIHQSFLRTARADTLAISYALPNSDIGSNGRDRRHAIIRLEDSSKAKSGKGVGYLCPTGMADIGKYSIVWPTKADHRYKPTDWIGKEAGENTVEELVGDVRRVDRYLGVQKNGEEPSKAYKTESGGRFHAPIALCALSHLIGGNRRSWEYLGRHGANSVALTPEKTFDGHAANTIHLFWSVMAAAQSDQPEAARHYYDYMKTFLILSECHDGGLYLQPWGRDPKNNDPAMGPRVLPTSAGIMLLSLAKRRLFITGKESQKIKF